MFQASSKATATATAAAAAVAAGVVIGKALSQEDALLRLRLRLAQFFRGQYTLRDVRIPESLLPRELRGAADAEGLVACDVAVKNGEIGEVAPPKSLRGIDCKGALLVACFADGHTHLVKTHAHPRARKSQLDCVERPDLGRHPLAASLPPPAHGARDGRRARPCNRGNLRRRALRVASAGRPQTKNGQARSRCCAGP